MIWLLKAKYRLAIENMSALKITEFNQVAEHSRHFTMKYTCVYETRKYALSDDVASRLNKANPYRPPTREEIIWFLKLIP